MAGEQRRLAAIVSADVAGYSRLMGRDERGTLAALKAHRAELIDDAIAGHGGRIVKTTGDGLLLEFPSVVAAVECCVAVQDGMAARNAGIADDDAIRFRVGIHLGGVIVDGDDIFGDGVNIAARLQEIGAPGGVTVSAMVHDYLDGAMAEGFVDLGDRELKNIRRPVRVWQRTADIVATAEPLALPDKPSIAVLPFDNMSGDPEQEYFSDGITEDIITALSRFRWFFVIARNSTFIYKGRAVDMKQVAAELGVRYVLEGSVRKAGNRIRITAQLIDAATGNHIWAERYDRELDDIFALQDEITTAIVGAVGSELTTAEQQRSTRRSPESLTAWELCHRAMWHYNKNDKDNYIKARALADQACAVDPGSATAQATLAYLIAYNWMLGYVPRTAEDDALAWRAARTAVQIDDRDAFAHMALGRVHIGRGEIDEARAATDRSIELNPNFALAYVFRAWVCISSGDGAAAIDAADRAMRLSPNDPLIWAMETWKGHGYWIQHRAEEALPLFTRACRHPNANYWSHLQRALALVDLGRLDEAKAAVTSALAIEPSLRLAFIEKAEATTRNPRRGDYSAGLRKAGLPG